MTENRSDYDAARTQAVAHLRQCRIDIIEVVYDLAHDDRVIRSVRLPIFNIGANKSFLRPRIRRPVERGLRNIEPRIGMARVLGYEIPQQAVAATDIQHARRSGLTKNTSDNRVTSPLVGVVKAI